MKKIKEYITKDLPEAGYLHCLGYKFALKKENSFYLFVFQDDDETIDKNVQDFWNNVAKVKAKHYADSLRSLKDLLFSRR